MIDWMEVVCSDEFDCDAPAWTVYCIARLGRNLAIAGALCTAFQQGKTFMRTPDVHAWTPGQSLCSSRGGK